MVNHKKSQNLKTSFDQRILIRSASFYFDQAKLKPTKKLDFPDFVKTYNVNPRTQKRKKFLTIKLR